MNIYSYSLIFDEWRIDTGHVKAYNAPEAKAKIRRRYKRPKAIRALTVREDYWA